MFANNPVDYQLSVQQRVPIHEIGRWHISQGVQLFHDPFADESLETSSLFAAISESLAACKDALIAKGNVDLETGCPCHIKQNYALIPAQVMTVCLD